LKPDEVRAVVRSSRQIDGWFLPDAAQLFGLLDEAQRRAGVTGDLFEIGVHHGRSTVLLAHMALESERVRVCDVFGEQDANPSRSGQGDRAIFERNMATLAPPGRGVDVFERSSDQLTPEEIGSPYRFFHIDGGHLLEEALSDLRLGASVLHERGVLVVDDPFKPEWPGVTEAIVRFLDERADLAPVVLGFNKLVICARAARPIYDEALAHPWSYADRRVWEVKELPIAGSTTRIFMIPNYRQIDGLDRWAARAVWLRTALRDRAARMKQTMRGLARDGPGPPG
jgi:hypothetical protein